ncbi:MAG: cytochrome c3 family protein [Sedimentisphaerales bacterium]
MLGRITNNEGRRTRDEKRDVIRRSCIVLSSIGTLLAFATYHPALSREVMPNSSRECAICHIRWVEAFDRTRSQADRMEEVLERQAGSGDMCLSCHDGSVVDSRFKIWSTRHHTTDSIPPATVKIPTDVFPLDAQGRMTCATCHTAHAVPESSDLRTVIFLRKPNVDSSLCLSCHAEHAQKNDFQHPLGDVNDPIPQEILDAGGKTSKDGRTIICQTCHEPHGARNAWMLVLPPSKLCIACHDDKSPETNPPAGAPIHHIGRVYPGFDPPESLLGEKATFGANGELSCLSCHRLHDASGAKPLLIRNNEDSSLCIECHQKERSVLNSPHDLRISSPQTVNARGQTASESGPCGACHRIHGWARDVPETNRPHSSACMECHESGGPGSVNRLYVDAHAVGTPLLEDMPTPPLPLEEGTRTIGCLTCHDPHKFVARDSEPVTRPSSGEPRATSHVQMPRSFLRREGSQLCMLCHEKLTDLPGQPHDPATFGPVARDTLALHPSIGPCRVCHTTHSAQGPHLWARTPMAAAGRITDLCGACHEDKLGVRDSVHDTETAQWVKDLGFVSKGSCIDCHVVHDPNEEGGIWSYVSDEADTSQSCQTCHRVGGPAKAMETTHLGKNIGAGIEGLLDNMGLGPDGRILCTTCHDIHQKEQRAGLLVAAVPKLCGACHEDKMGIPGSVHDPGTAEWAKKLGFVSKGSCIDCHPIHDPSRERGIWAAIGGDGVRQPGYKNHRTQQGPKLLVSPSQDSAVCLACHPRAGGIIGTLHDLRISAPEATNVRDETVAESGPCGSCHLVHRNSDTGGTWAQGAIFQDKHGSGLCTSCHREGQCASARVPDYLDHPDVALVNRTDPDDPEYMPTFDERGEPSRTGAISCLTCHEPHTALSAGETKGNFSPYTRMFLRPAAHHGICTDCHATETLWRFLYYHKERRNPRDGG